MIPVFTAHLSFYFLKENLSRGLSAAQGSDPVISIRPPGEKTVSLKGAGFTFPCGSTTKTTKVKTMSIITLKPAFRAKTLELIKQAGNVVTGVKAPVTDVLYSAWKVVDPLSGAVMCLKVLLPFKELLKGIEGMNPSVIRSMPDKPIWFTLMVDQGETASDYEANIPEWDERFIPQAEHVSLLIDVLTEPLSCGYGRGYYGWGEAGVGKTSTALWLMAVIRQACVHVNCRPGQEVEEFFLTQVAQDGVWKQIPGPVMNAVLRDYVLIIDELDLAPAEFWPALNNLIEGRRYAVPGYAGAFVQAQSTFRVLGFGNTGPSGSEALSYAGRSPFDASVWDRFYKDCYGTPTAGLYKSIIRANFSAEEISDDLRDHLAGFAVAVNAATAAGTFAENLSPRSLNAMIRIYLRNRAYVRSPLLYAMGTVLGTIRDSSEALEQFLGLYTAEIGDGGIGRQDLMKQWKARACAPVRNKDTDSESTSESDSSSEAAESDTESQAASAASPAA